MIRFEEIIWALFEKETEISLVSENYSLLG